MVHLTPYSYDAIQLPIANPSKTSKKLMNKEEVALFKNILTGNDSLKIRYLLILSR